MIIKTCTICTNDFIPNCNRQTTCSQSCRTLKKSRYDSFIREKNRKALPEKHCSKCGEKFNPNKNSNTICAKCKTKEPVTRACIICGTEFTVQGKGVKLLCSDACAKKQALKRKAIYYVERREEREPSIKICGHCGNEFTPDHPNEKHCSEKCRYQNKLVCQTNHRQKIKENFQKPLITCVCKVCNSDFVSVYKLHFCSDECRAEQKRQKARAYNLAKAIEKPNTIKPSKEPKLKAIKLKKQPVAKAPAQQVLNKRSPKAEKQAVEVMIELNRNAPAHDREALTKKNIVSPDLSAMEFKVFDKATRKTTYFRNEERYNNHLNNMKK